MFFQNKKSRFEGLTSIRPLFRKLGISVNETFYKDHAINFLNVAQFFGVINDNIFKFLIVFQFIALYGEEKSSQVLFMVGIIYVLPFLIFSAAAGALADYFSKQRIIAVMKAVEVGIMIFGVFAFWMQSTPILYVLFFLLSLQSALFGPPKYSIIPELVKDKSISKANGTISASTYLAIIAGMLLAPFLTDLAGKNFVIVALMCTVMAVIGYIASLFIPVTPKSDRRKKINPLFVVDIYKTLRKASKFKYLLPSIFASAYFLFIGAFFQLNIIPFAMENLGISDVNSVYLFATTAIGIAAGGYIAGKLCKRRIELGLPSMSLLILSLLTIILYFFSFQLGLVLFLLLLIGFFGGLTIVPLDSFIQTTVPVQQRGQVVAAASFVGFLGALFAPITIWLLQETLQLSAVQSFLIIGVFSVLVSFFMAKQMPHLFFNYVCRTILNPFAGVDVQNFPDDQSKPIILTDPNFEWKHIAYIVSYSSDIILCLPVKKRAWYHSLVKKITTIRFIYYGENKGGIARSFLEHSKKLKKRIPCLILHEELTQDQEDELRQTYDFTLKGMNITAISRKEVPGKFSRSKVTIEISEDIPPAPDRWYPFD